MPPIRGRRALPADTNARGHRANSLGMDEHKLAAVLDKLDKKPGTKSSVKRTYSRMPFRERSLKLTLVHPGGTSTSVQVVCRNLSRGGIGVLHSAFAHSGTRCVVAVPRIDGETDQIEGTIVRCSHVSGQIHELGILFDEQIPVETYIAFDPASGMSSFERVDPETLEGTLVALLSSEIEGRMLGHFLSESRLKIKLCGSPEEGAALVADACAVALIDLTVPCAEEMAIAARQVNPSLPLIAIASDSSKQTLTMIGGMGFRGLIVKPLASEKVLNNIAECLLTMQPEDEADDSTEQLSPELVSDCIEQVHAIVGQLRGLTDGDDAMQGYELCRQITAICAPIGLDDLNNAAVRASKTISETMSFVESEGVLQELFRMCDRVKNSAN
ncbi:MAG: PilZ domain-containing protein [Phycisphaerales bacterium JB054]